MKRDSKLEYYRKFFEENKKKSSPIWKGIRSIVNINNTSRKDINLLNDKGKNVSDPTKIAELLNKYFASVGPNIDKKIPKSLKNFKEYMKKIKVNKTFFLNATTPQEIFDIILAFDLKKSLGPNSIPMYMLKVASHDILCEKLMLYGFRGNSYLLIKSFLTNRKQFVSINGFNSSHIEITCGVPQGSTLGPLLFLLYINDLNLYFNNAIASHFADDTCIMYGSSKPKTLETVLNCDLKKISDWLKANRLSLNVKKSKLIFFQKKQSNFDL